MKKKIKALVPALTMLALMISGCSTDTGKEPNNGTTGSANSDSKYKDKLNLSIFLSASADSILPQGDKDFVKKTIEQKFNVALDVKYMPMGTDRTSKLNLQLASGDAPDFFVVNGTDSQKYITDKIVADMSPYITPTTVPNYYKWLTDVELKRYQIEDAFTRAPIPFVRDVYRSYYVRKDWLDKLNLKMPTNYEEMMDTMRAFTNKDPDGNGKKDTFGISAVGNGNSISLDFPQYIKHGLIGSFMIIDNRLVDVQSDPKIEGVLNDIKAMMKEGIVDPDWFLAKGTQHLDKAIQGKVGIVASADRNFALDSNPTSIQNKSKAINPKADWVPFHPFAQTGAWSENLPGDAFLFSKVTAEKSPEKIKRLADILDWFCSEEGFILTHYGVENKHYTRSGSKITLKPDVFQKDIVEQGNFLAIYGSLVPAEPERLGLEVINPIMTSRDQEIIKTIKSYKIIPSIGTNVSPPQGFNLADFRAKMREYQVKILFDEKDASNWPKYRQELMTTYKGNEMIRVYEEQIKKAGVIK